MKKWWNPRTWMSSKSRWGIPILDLIAASQGGTGNDYTFEKGATKGYMDTDIVFAGIDLISSSVASVPKRAYIRDSKGEEKALPLTHPLNKLLMNPNPLQNKESDFAYAATAFRLLGGKSFIWMNTGFTQGTNPKAKPLEMWAMEPGTAEMRSSNGNFWYQVNQKSSTQCTGPVIRQTRFDVDPITGQSNLLNWHTFSPKSMCDGISPLKPANTSMDIYRAGNIWNKGYFENGCRPSTALSAKDSMGDRQYERLKKEINEIYSGLQNGNGKPLLLDGGITAVELSKSPKDADFSRSHDQSQKDIFRALQIPPILLAIGSDNTFNNVGEAQLWFWGNTTIPITDDLVAELNLNLVPRYNQEGLFIKADYSQIPALEPRRKEMWERAEKSTTMTI